MVFLRRASPPAIRRLLLLSPFSRYLSTTTDTSTSELAKSISAELLKISEGSDSSGDPTSHFNLHFSGVRFTGPLLSEVIALSPASGRAAADLFRYLAARPSHSLPASDATLSDLVHHLGRRRDFKAALSLLSDYHFAAGPLSISAALLRLSSAGRPTAAIRFFQSLPNPPSLPLLSSLVDALSSNGFTSYAERSVKDIANVVFPNLQICYSLIQGYSSELKLADAQRLMGEMLRGGFELGTPAYNSILDCICRLCRKKDPLRLLDEAHAALADMDSVGTPRDSSTFHVLIYNFCKIRQTEYALKLFREMGEWGCSPEAATYLALIRSLYQAARVAEGDEMVGFMRAAGFGEKLDRKAYYGFIKILCGIERVEHAVKVFRMMKGYGHAPGIKTYELLMEKLAAHNQGDRANALFKEAAARGLPVTTKVYKVDPRYVKVKKESKEKKRETLPEKMARKRRRLRKLRLSFVKKPRSMRRVI